MTRRHQAFDARSRSPVDDDDAFENGVLKDGYGMRVPLTMMDSMQKAVAADARRRKVVERDPMGRVRSTFEEEEEDDEIKTDAAVTVCDALGRDGLYLHQPGFRFMHGGARNTESAVLQAQDRACEDARDKWITEMSNAWCTKSGRKSYE